MPIVDVNISLIVMHLQLNIKIQRLGFFENWIYKMRFVTNKATNCKVVYNTEFMKNICRLMSSKQYSSISWFVSKVIEVAQHKFEVCNQNVFDSLSEGMAKNNETVALLLDYPHEKRLYWHFWTYHPLKIVKN